MRVFHWEAARTVGEVKAGTVRPDQVAVGIHLDYPTLRARCIPPSVISVWPSPGGPRHED